jgi:hypothetical protein
MPLDHDERAAEPASRSWAAPVRVGSMALLVLMSLWMISMHRVHVFTADAIPIALLVACLGMHVFMHRGHGGGHPKGDGGT